MVLDGTGINISIFAVGVKATCHVETDLIDVERLNACMMDVEWVEEILRKNES